MNYDIMHRGTKYKVVTAAGPLFHKKQLFIGIVLSQKTNASASFGSLLLSSAAHPASSPRGYGTQC